MKAFRMISYLRGFSPRSLEDYVVIQQCLSNLALILSTTLTSAEVRIEKLPNTSTTCDVVIGKGGGDTNLSRVQEFGVKIIRVINEYVQIRGAKEVKFVWIGCGDCTEIFEVLRQWNLSNHDHIVLRIFAVEMISIEKYKGERNFCENINKYTQLGLLDVKFGVDIFEYEFPFPVSILYTTAVVNSIFLATVIKKAMDNCLLSQLSIAITFSLDTYVSLYNKLKFDSYYDEDMQRIQKVLGQVSTTGNTSFTYKVIPISFVDKVALLELIKVETLEDMVKMYSELKICCELRADFVWNSYPYAFMAAKNLYKVHNISKAILDNTRPTDSKYLADVFQLLYDHFQQYFFEFISLVQVIKDARDKAGLNTFLITLFDIQIPNDVDVTKKRKSSNNCSNNVVKIHDQAHTGCIGDNNVTNLSITYISK